MEVHIMTALTTRSQRSPAVVDGTPGTAPARAALLTPAVTLGVALVEYVGNSLSLWWITLLVGIATGWLRPRRGTVALAAGTILGWGAGILVESGGRTLDIAGVVSALALSARNLGWLIITITLVYAVLLALAGSWLGAAARRMVAAYRRGEAAPQPEEDAPAAEASAPGDDLSSSAEVEEPSNV
jgi:hypothetical protein